MGGKRSECSPSLPPCYLLELHCLKPTGNAHASGSVGTLSMGQDPEAQRMADMQGPIQKHPCPGFGIYPEGGEEPL